MKWPELWSDVHITVKELLPVVIGVAMWGNRWRGKKIRCRCDNAAVVAMLGSGSSKNERAMHLLRCLFFFLASCDVSIVAEHVRGVENGPADALSRGNHLSFLSQVRFAVQEPMRVPEELQQALVLERPDWTSESWRNLLKSFSRRG